MRALRALGATAPRAVAWPAAALGATGPRRRLAPEEGAGRRGLRAGHVCRMGRASAKRAPKKNKEDAKKAKVYGKFGKLIQQLAKAGGTSPESNPALRDAIAQAQAANCPKDVIDRNLKRAGDKDASDFTEATYEAYGAGGVGLVIKSLTDNLNRTASDVKTAVNKGGGKMAESGSVLFNFDRKGILRVAEEDEDKVFEAAMEAGAEDIVPEAGGGFKVFTEPEEWGIVRDALEGALALDMESSGIELVSKMEVEVSDADDEVNSAIIEKLMACDDVDEVYSTQG